uniref:TFIIS central domain-containing protein n=1 Tax=Kalanchoe fedtschenkoi TaxID=63787 RepID=A0A7N0ZSX1_KALFE
MDQLHPITSTVQNVQMVPVGSVSSKPASVHSMKPNEQMRFLEPMAHYGSGGLSASMSGSGLYVMPKANYSGFQQMAVPNNVMRGDMGPMFSDPKSQSLQMPAKRKSPMANLPDHPRVAMPSMKFGQSEHRPWLNTSAPNNSNFQHQVQSPTGAAAHYKRTTQFQAGPPKSGSQKSSTPRSHPSQGQPFSRVHNESNESVRSKLRESISAALALVTEKEKSFSKEGTSATAGSISSGQMQECYQSAEIASSISPAELSGENPKEAKEDCSTQSETNAKSQLTAVATNVGESPQTHENTGQELNMIDLLPDDESIAGNFFVKDDLLQGNGLSWVLDFDAWVAEKESHDPKKQKVGENRGGSQEVKESFSPQDLALQIELELFKLFGGVNKKYKEKGRSLLFNLKDRNNPELREKVMSGEISPARLCSMTAEELASKELSEWRIAKAEEFEQMKILPDSEIDLRRLVKKTHKGEFQVEVEEDDVSVEVSVGSSSFPRRQTEANDTKSQTGQISDGDQKETVNEKNNSEEQNLDCTITIPSNESTDLMQGLIEDELKDAEFLPPIVSLDEFMESLHSEPPFENLPEDAGKTKSPENDHSEGPSESKSAKLSPDHHMSATSKTQDNLDAKDPKPDGFIKPTDSHPKTEVSPPATEVKADRIWEGSIQLSISSKISVSGFFKSGEKTPTKEWPHIIEIKGRVRLDAFEKFLQDLYKSRSRSIMVMHVILKEREGADSDALSQVVDSYVADDRVGFAEPVRGLEVYLCPNHPKILDRIGKHLAKDQKEGALTLSGEDKGLIGVIVWRKAHVSPNSSSHHKHSLKKHQQEHYSSRRHNHHHQDRNINVKSSSNLTPKYPPLASTKAAHFATPIKVATDEDDLPPGFGPPASQDDDDLPEFNFSGGLSRSFVSPNQKPVVSQSHNRPADQMRQLIQKYGQNGAGLVVKSWKDDDDDDIPEWQPQVPLPPAPTQTQHSYHALNQPMLQHLINQQQQLLRLPLQQSQAPLQPPMPAAFQQTSGAPAWPQQQQLSGVWMNPQQGQFYGTQSKGF